MSRRSLFESLEPRQMLAITVDTLVDESDGDILDGDISLRDAIAAASPGETINFAASLSGGSIDLTEGELTLSDDIIIDGPGAGLLTIDGQGLGRVFKVTASSTAEIKGLTITGGHAAGSGANDDGGGIYNLGDLTLKSVDVIGNNADDLGGGITSFGPLHIENSSISENVADKAAGVYADLTVGETFRIIASTLAHNSTVAGGNNGALLLKGGTDDAQIINTTISNNSANYGAGIRVLSATDLEVVNTTIVENAATGHAGGIQNAGSGTITLHNTILSANTAGFATSHDSHGDLSGSARSESSYNLIGTAFSSGLTNGVDGNTLGISDPGLSPLGDYGGLTHTHVPLAGSPAIDSGDVNQASSSTDQRGFNRNFFDIATRSDGVDIGAVEQGLIVTTPDDEDDSVFDRADLSLREAIATAQGNYSVAGEVNRITFGLGVSGTLGLAHGELLIDNSEVAIEGPGADSLIIDAQGASRVIRVTGSATAEISGLTITGGHASGAANDDGGGIMNGGDLTLLKVEVVDNTADDSGGGIYTFGPLHIEESSIIENEAGIAAGIRADLSSNEAFRLIASTLAHNSTIAGGNNGALLLKGGTNDAQIINSTISNNTANYGAGIRVLDATDLRIINGTITDNNATGLAGGIQNAGSGTITLHNTILAGNTSGHSNQDFRDSWGSLAGDIGDPSSYNLIGVAGTGSHSSGITDGVNENVVGTAAMAADPLLTPLGDYGGNTPTHKPNPFGPAGTAGSYEIATAAGLYADQRGNLYSDEPVPQMSIGSVLSTGASASQFPLPPELIEFTPEGILRINDNAELPGPVSNVIYVSADEWGNVLVNYRPVEDSAGVTPLPAANVLGIEIFGDTEHDAIDLSGVNSQQFPGIPNSGWHILIDGGGDSDDIVGSELNDLIYGGSGDDIILGLGGEDEIHGDDGDDAIEGGDGDDILGGGSAADFNSINGGEGNDTYLFEYVVAIDQISDSGGIDSFDFSAWDWFDSPDSRGVQIDIGLGQQQTSLDSGIYFSGAGIENVIGSPFDDTITGSNAANLLEGGGGDDVLVGGEGDDVIDGSDGADTLEGGEGNDTLVGGAGNDAYVFAGTQALGTDSVEENAGDGIDEFNFSGIDPTVGGLLVDLTSSNDQITLGTDLAPHHILTASSGQEIENVIGTVSDDTIGGNSYANDLRGASGNDLLFGRSGTDALHGDDGDDTLRGGLGTDFFYGGAGFDDAEFIDDQDTSGFSMTGSFTSHTAAGVHSQYMQAAANSSSTATWSFSGLSAGHYAVYVTWPEGLAGLSAAAPFTVAVDGGSAVPVNVDQSQDPSGNNEVDALWEKLGVYETTSGDINVSLSDAADLPVVADAVRLVRTDAQGLPLDAPAEIRGVKFHDNNIQNGIRDTDLIAGDEPTVVYVIDVSGSTAEQFGGTSVGNINGDSHTDSFLDAELKGFIDLTENLIDRGLGDKAKISVVVYGTSSIYVDMDPDTAGTQYWTTPNANTDGNSEGNVEEVLRSIQISHLSVGNGTSFEAGLSKSNELITNELPPATDINIIFLSDGGDQSPHNFSQDVMDLHNDFDPILNLRAFGVGPNSDLTHLSDIDPAAIKFNSTDELLQVFGGLEGDTTVFSEDPLEDWFIYIDENDNGVRDGAEPFFVTGEQGRYTFQALAAGTYTITERQQLGWFQTGPENNAAHSKTIVNAASDVFAGVDFGNIDGHVIQEDTHLVKTQSTTLTIPTNPDALRVDFSSLLFDAAGNTKNRDVNDAFEVAILKDGVPVVPTVRTGDAVFNITQGREPAWATGVELLDASGALWTNPGADVTEGSIQVDISSLTPGEDIQIVARLVNNDADDTSRVAVSFREADPLQGRHAMLGSGAATDILASSNFASSRLFAAAPFGDLHDVTRAFDVSFTHTTFDAANDGAEVDYLEARITLTKKAGSLPVRGDLLLAVDGIVNQLNGAGDGTQLENFDGRLPVNVGNLPAGTPYVRLSGLLDTTDTFYDDESSLSDVALRFLHPAGQDQRFDFELVVLGELNDPPKFTSDPYAHVRGNAYPVDLLSSPVAQPRRVLEVIASNGNTFRYVPETYDPNGDRVSIEVIAGPSGMVTEDPNGDGRNDSVAWTPAPSPDGTSPSPDEGVHRVILRAIDEHGTFDPAEDQVLDVHVVTFSDNRPPTFTTTPENKATVGVAYSYDADAFDPDGNTLDYNPSNLSLLGARPQHYEISLAGQAGTTLTHLAFVNMEGAAGGTSRYSGIRLYDTDWLGERQVLQFRQNRFTSFTHDDAGGAANVLGDSSLVEITGDAWKQYLLDAPYAITANTVLEFSFASDMEGDLHGIGITGDVSSPMWFQLYGTAAGSAATTPGDESHNGEYVPAWTDPSDFNVDASSGEVTWTPPTEALGKWVRVNLTVSDQQAPALMDTQSYDLFVAGDPENTPPVITSTPVKHHELPGAYTDPLGDVEVKLNGVIQALPIDLDLNFDPATGQFESAGPFEVTITRHDDAVGGFTSPSFSVTETVTFNDDTFQDWIELASNNWDEELFMAGGYIEIIGSASNDAVYLIDRIDDFYPDRLYLDTAEQLSDESNVSVTATPKHLTVRTAVDQEVTDFRTSGGYGSYEEAIADILLGGGSTELTNVIVSLPNPADSEGGYRRTFSETSSYEYDANARSTGIFVNPGNATLLDGTYGMSDFGVVLSTGDAGDYGYKSSHSVFADATVAFGPNIGQSLSSPPPNARPADAETQEFLLDQITDGTPTVVLTVNDTSNVTDYEINFSVGDSTAFPRQFSTLAAGPAYENVTWTYDIDHIQEDTVIPDDQVSYRLDAAPFDLEDPTVNYSFDLETGILNWTPTASDVGTEVYFVITAIDGNSSGGSNTPEEVTGQFSQAIRFTIENSPAPSRTIEKVSFDATHEWVVEFSNPLPSGAILGLDQASIDNGITVTNNNHSGHTTTDEFVELHWNTPPGGAGNQTHYDATQLDLNFDAGDVNTLFFNVTFASEEFEEYKGDAFIDAFGIFVNGQPNAALVDDPLTTEQDLLPININHPGMILTGSPQATGVIVGSTELDGVLSAIDDDTGMLSTVVQFEIPITPNAANQLTFILADSGDARLDTTVYISAISAVDSNAVDVRLQPSQTEAAEVVDITVGGQPGNVVQDVEVNGTAAYELTFTGDGAAYGFDLDFVDDNNPSYKLGSIPVTVNNDYFYLVTADDADDDQLTFSLPVKPAGAEIDPVDGRITWDPPNTAGSVAYDFVVRVEDGQGGYDEQAFTVTVSPDLTNTVPTIISPLGSDPAFSARILNDFSLPVAAADGDNDPLKYYLTNNVPTGMTIDVDTGLIRWTPAVNQQDTSFSNIEVKVYDGRGGVATTTFDVVVDPDVVRVNSQPTITSDPPTNKVVIGEEFRYDVAATDDDNDRLTYSMPLRPSGMSINAESGLIVWNPSLVHEGNHNVLVRVEDGNGGITTQFFTLEVINDNIAPTIDSVPYGPARVGDQDPSTGTIDPYTYQVVASDDNGDPLFYEVDAPAAVSLVGQPPISIDANGLLSWTPGVLGDYSITITATDRRGGVATQRFTLPVIDGNSGPKLTLLQPDLVFKGETWTYTATAADFEDDAAGSPLDFDIDEVSKARGLTIANIGGAGVITWLDPDGAAPARVQVTVTDSGGLTNSGFLTLPVNVRPPSNEAPTFVEAPFGAAMAGKEWSYTLRATDFDQDHVLTIEVIGTPPTWLDQQVGNPSATATGGPNSGVELELSGTPQPSDAGKNFPVEVKVTDEHGAYSTATLWVPVVANSQPFIIKAVESHSPSLGQQAQYEFEVIDFDGDDLRVELLSPAPGIGFFELNEADFGQEEDWQAGAILTGASDDFEQPSKFRLNFTATEEGVRFVTVRVTDSFGKSSEHTIELDVVDRSNASPSVALSVPNVLYIGQSLSIQVQADDPDGDTLQYFLVDGSGTSVTTLDTTTAGGQSLPTNMTINTDGVISWTPSSGDAGQTFSFQVRVTDGTYIVDLEPVTFDVRNQPVTSSPPVLLSGVVSTPTPLELTYYEFDVIDFDGNNLTLSPTVQPANSTVVFQVNTANFGETPVWTTPSPTGTIASASANPAEPSQFRIGFNPNAPDGPGEQIVTFTLDDGTTPVPHTITFDVFDADNRAPAATLSAPETHFVDELLALQVVARDVDGDTLTYKLLDQNGFEVDQLTAGSGTAGGGAVPDAMAIDPDTGEITWTPSSTGTNFTFVARVTDGNYIVDFEPVVLDVIDPPSIDAPPYILRAIESANVDLNEAYDYEFEVIDFNGGNLDLSFQSTGPGHGQFSYFDTTPGVNRWVAASTLPNVSTDFNAPSRFRLSFTPESTGAQSISVTVTDATSLPAQHTMALEVIDRANTPPNVRMSVPQTLFAGDTLDIRVQGDNPDSDGDFLTYAFVDNLGNTFHEITGKTNGGGAVPSGMMIDPESGRITWKPTAEQITPATGDAYTFTVQVTDGRFTVNLGPATLSVVAPPEPEIGSAPFIVRAPANVRTAAGEPIELEFAFVEFNGDTITLTSDLQLGEFAESQIVASDDPENPTVVLYRLTPGLGDTQFTIMASDVDGSVPYTVKLEVYDPEPPEPVNTIPGGSLRAREITAANEQFVAQATATDPDGDTPIFALLDGTGNRVTEITVGSGTDGGGEVPIGLKIDPSTGRITWTPANDKINLPDEKYTYTVVIDDDDDHSPGGYNTIGPVDLVVVNRITNTVPEITSSPSDFVTLGDGSLTYQATAADADNDPVTWTLVEGPEGASIDPITGLFRWVSTASDVDVTATAVIQATDPYGAFDQQGLSLVVTVTTIRGNTAPEFTSTPPQPGAVGDDYHYLVRTKDADNERVAFLPLEGETAGLSIVDNGDGTAVVSWLNPGANDSRDFTIVVRDERGLESRQTVSVGIGSTGSTSSVVDTPPDILSRPPLSVGEGQLYYHQIIATDPDTDETGTIVYSLVVTPSGGGSPLDLSGQFAPSTGLIEWTPDTAGAYDVIIGATQANVTTTLSYTLQVTPPGAGNTPPALQPANDLQAAPGQVFEFDIPAFDPDNDPLTYFLVDADNNLVRELDGLSITPEGRVAWSVPAGIQLDDNPSRTVRIHVQDNEGRAADITQAYTRDYSVAIVDDRAPTVSLSTSTLRPTPGETIGFVVLASDDLGRPDLRLVLEVPDAWTPEPGGTVELALNAGGVGRYQVPSTAPTDGTGVITVTAYAYDGVNDEVATAPVNLTVRAVDTNFPTVDITSPRFNGYAIPITESTPLMGKAYDLEGQTSNLVYYSVSALPVGGGDPIVLAEDGNPNGPTIIQGVGDPNNSGLLATLSPFTLADGLYDIQVFAVDLEGKTSTSTLPVSIASAVKLGNFSFTVDDMTIPVDGFPITVRRTYDTLNANTRGDFGYGWSMDLITGKLEVDLSNNPDNDFWDGLGYAPAIRYGSQISIELPGGETQTFTAVPVPLNPVSVEGGRFGAILGLANIFAIAFQPELGQGTKLDLVGGDAHLYPSDFYDYLPLHLANEPFGTMPLIVDFESYEFRALSGTGGSDFGIPFNPATPGDMPRLDYRLTLADDSQYIFNSATGELISATDAYGNRLEPRGNRITTYSPDNEETGSIEITRQNGLVTRIEGPDGQAMTYAYNDLDNLIEVTDRQANFEQTGPTTTIRYGEETSLSDSGVDVPDHVLTTIENAYGVPAFQVGFDAQGRVRKLGDAAGNEAEFTYEFNAADIDPSFVGTGYTLETVADAKGVPTEVLRDGRGNVLRSIQRTSNNNSPGLDTDDTYLVSVFEYDDADNQTAIYTPFTVDELTGGNRYTDPPPAPAETTSTFNEFGQPLTEVDEAGSVTEFTYNDRGQPTVITDPSGNETLHTYDHNGNLIGSVNPTGESTTFTYELGRITSTAMLDSQGKSIGATNLSYDLAGQLASSSNANGVTRYFVYDQLGNQTLAYWHWVDPQSSGSTPEKTIVARSEYDFEGNQIGAYQYELDGELYFSSAAELDAAGYVASSSTSTTYDLLGRVESTTDRFGKSTYNLYDSRGNIVEMRTNANGADLWLVTRIAFDDNGRELVSSDPFIVENPFDPAVDDTFDISLDTPLRPDGSTTLADSDYRSVHTIYDDLGRVIETRQLEGTAAKITLRVDPAYSSNRVLETLFNETYSIAAIQSSESTTYDPQGRVFKTVSADSLATYFEYDDAGRQRAVIMGVDLDHNSSLDITFGGLGTPADEFDLPDGGAELVRTEFTYDESGRQEVVNDARNVQTKNVYDDLGRVLATIVDEGGLEIVTQNVFDSTGRRIAEIDPRGRRTNFTYDDQGRLIEVRLPRINDADGGDPSVNRYGSETGDVVYQYRYDDYGNQILIRDPMDGDLGGSADNKETVFTYDHLGRQTSRTLPAGQVEWMIYDDTAVSALATPATSTALGELAFSVDFEGNLTSFLYDNSATGVGRLVNKRYYDANQLAGLTVTSSTTASDLANAISSLTPDRSIGYQFDAFGRATIINDSEFSSPTTHAFDIDGRLIKLDSPQGVIHYEYDHLDRVTRTHTGGLDQTPGNAVGDAEEFTDTRYEYDELGRLKTVTATERKNDGATGEAPTEYFYDKNGNLDRTEQPNGVASDYVYDAANRLVELYHYVDTTGDANYQVGDDLRLSYEYVLNQDGRRKQETESNAGGGVRTIDWVYDELGRLSEERHDVEAGGNTDDFIARYGYDLAGNRVLMQKDNGNSNAAAFAADQTTTYEYDANDRLESETKDATDNTNDRHIVYEYDGTTQTRKLTYHDMTANPSSLREEVVMSYDETGRLASITESEFDTNGSTTLSVVTTEYKYNESGVRVSQTVDNGVDPSVTTIFHIDPHNHTNYAQILEEGVDNNDNGRLEAGEIDTAYTLGHDVLAQTVPENATDLPAGVNPGDVVYFLHDGHGSTRGLTDAANAIIQQFAYDAYGNRLDAAVALTTLLFSGEQTDATGLQYLRARFYDPANGRFNRLDPFAGNSADPQSLHKYLYTHGDPVNAIDPTGERSIVEMTVTFNISSMLRKSNQSSRLGVLQRSFGRKRWQVYVGIGPSAPKFSSLIKSAQKLERLAGHGFIATINLRTTTGLRYDVGAESFPLIPFKSVSGNISVRPTTLAKLKRRTTFLIPIGKMSHRQLIAYQAAMIAFPATDTVIRYAWPGITGCNCYTWTIRAAVTARVFSLLPL